MKYDQQPIKCKCSECGKVWNKGEQEDNETICLRCAHLSMIEQDEDFDRYEME